MPFNNILYSMQAAVREGIRFAWDDDKQISINSSPDINRSGALATRGGILGKRPDTGQISDDGRWLWGVKLEEGRYTDYPKTNWPWFQSIRSRPSTGGSEDISV
ncbi:hypothetical protein H072_475 [Dactylellina haptotyla CBS 200.50]|uniref:Uncharacterized protein n=1 Tax=Dactylellina haptotyla (strain CBS 200.50) TaxID=1284197 RepID=S8ARF9_DACHA|nr:hypothetical protein H072_475 [Dactylellina haptotyla CBS 200.50]